MRPANAFGSLLITAFFTLAGVITLYDSSHYADTDSQVFPQAVAIAMIVFSLLSLILQWLKPSSEEGFGQGSWWRRALLVLSMLLACGLMPLIGFLPAGAVAFAGALVAGMHDRWTLATLLLYGGSGAVIMTGFYALFKFVLHVPLP